MKQILVLSAVLVSLLCSCTPQPAATSAGPSFDEVVTTRRSIRNYDATKSISEAEVRQLLTTTQEAPSWANGQPTKYYVVEGGNIYLALKKDGSFLDPMDLVN